MSRPCTRWAQEGPSRMTSTTAHPDDLSSTPGAEPGARRPDIGRPVTPSARIITQTGAPTPDHAAFTVGEGPAACSSPAGPAASWS